MILIPHTQDGPKTGLDDLLVANGPDGLRKLMSDAKPALFWEIEGIAALPEYSRTEPLRDLFHKLAILDLLDDAAKKKFSVVLVFKLDRAFRSVKHMHDTLSTWEVLGISFRSIREQFETSTALGRLLMNLLAALAEFELELIRERVKAGMERAARQGKRIGRPKVTARRGFTDRYKTVLERLNAGELSRRKAAKELGIGYATLKRLLDGNYSP
jgi:hypothetical protein